MAQKTKKFSLSPLGDRIVVRPSEKEGERKLASGIIIPETVDKEKLMKGEVVAVGPGRKNDDGKRIPTDVKPGDTVFFKKPWDEPIKVEAVEYYVLPESEIILIEN
jgi:chaperonin GroES